MEGIPLHPITLRFVDAPAEKAFRHDYAARSVWLVRGAMLLGCLQYATFGLIDPLMISESLATVWFIRSVVCLFILVLLVFSYSPRFADHLQAFISSVPLVAGAGVLAMILVAQEIDGYYDYYAGLMLILFYVHVLLRLRFMIATAVSLTIVLAYGMVATLMVDTPPAVIINNTFFLGSANLSGMVASYALEFYARKVFWQNQVLHEKRSELEIEHARKSRELEETRQLQLSMLPGRVPVLPDIALAVYMKTASEVGGDYYDFDVAADGTLTFAIGDATGHGARAGAMVTATKILFTTLLDEPDVAQVLQRAAGPLRRAGLSRLYMSLAVGKLRGRTLEIAGAGIPPALIYRASSRTIETIPLKGIPLGSFASGGYRKHIITLEPDDTLLLMTDGFPELFDSRGEMLGYERVVELFGEVADREPDDIVSLLDGVVHQWVEARPLSDDVTLMVLKARPVSELEVPEGRMDPEIAVFAEA